ncbi:hypothetical protein DdX_18002 [Ditylenchus destructor]|uniref:J domain-containing protein n=1 Tax=Ditylenchus destructor TaxID=166010 RepID=A0AAD4MLI8_9BILA|nr:hypothetical protein DdX_18002 [Ditylenchus destructor]
MCLIWSMLYTLVLCIDLNQPINPALSIHEMLDEDLDTSPTVIRSAFMEIRRQFHPDICRHRHPDATEEQFHIWENNHKIMEDVYRKYAENPNANTRHTNLEKAPPKPNGDLAPVQHGKERNTRSVIPYAYMFFSGASQPIVSKTLDALFNDGQVSTISSKTTCVWHSRRPLWCSSDCPGDGHMWEPIALHSGKSGFAKGSLKRDMPSSELPNMPLFGSTCLLAHARIDFICCY